MPTVPLAVIVLGATAETAGELLAQIVSLSSYGFYLFSGAALLVAAYKLQQGDIGGFVKGMMGAGVLCLTPVFVSEIIALFKI